MDILRKVQVCLIILIYEQHVLCFPYAGIVSKKVSLDRVHWQKVGVENLQQALYKNIEMDDVQNVIMFVGAGMGPETIAAARVYKHSDMGYLSFERFPFTGILKTYCGDNLTPDSGSSGTAFFCGSKSNRRTVGVDVSVKYDDCLSSLNTNSHLHSIFSVAQKFGKATGFVTTGRVTHGSVSALYAHSANVDWECDGTLSRRHRRCKDIAKQLIQDDPGRKIKVIMGGGRQCLQSDVNGTANDPTDTEACYSTDGRDLIREWSKDKHDQGVKYAVATNNLELERILTSNVDYVLGIFANSNIRYGYARERGSYSMPSLSKMTEKAINILQKNNNGFFLVVEHALIDKAHHEGHAKIALDETVALSDAVEKVVHITEYRNIAKKTLIIVTSSFAQSMAISGYPSRASSVLGIAGKSQITGVAYTTLLYSTGGKQNFHYYTDNVNYNTQVQITPYYGKMSKYMSKYEVVHCPRQGIYRHDPIYNSTDDYAYSQHAFILAEKVHHSGTDVNIYAKGPYSYYFHRTHDITYLYYIICLSFQKNMYKQENVQYSPFLDAFSGSPRHFNIYVCFIVIVFGIIFSIYENEK